MNRRRSPITTRFLTPQALAALTALTATAACQLDDPSDAAVPDPETSGDIAALDGPPAPCPWAPTIAVTPAVIPPTHAGVPITFDVAITNANPATCAPLSFVFDVQNTGLLVEPRPLGPIITGPPPLRTVASGATSHITVTATVPASADGGDTLRMNAVALQPLPAPPPDPSQPPPPPTPPVVVSSPPVVFTVAAEPGCQVSAARELMIKNVSVVDDPVRTVFDPASTDPRNGVWTLKHLAEQMARTPHDAPRMIEDLLTSLSTPQTINGFTVAARPGLESQVLASWPRTPNGALDLARAPLRLQAIVSRLDLRDLSRGDAGEGRFVFAFDLPGPPAPGAPPPQATIIFEYKLPASRERDVVRWAEAFHALGGLPFGEGYNAALTAITERFVRRGARPTHPNGSAINAVRTNEIPFGDNGLWELREFHLSRITGRLEPAALAQTPDLSFNQSAALVSYINANQAKILAGTHTVPSFFQGQRFQAGAVFNDLDTWFAPGVTDEARHQFAINTCNGCHSARETGTGFLHLVPRPPGAEALRSRWLTGTIIDDPESGAPRLFDDLGRRKADLKSIVCDDPALLELQPERLQKGISRVH